jgi:hypothetical protein
MIERIAKILNQQLLLYSNEAVPENKFQMIASLELSPG